jgi:uncharacterized RDD family membrane protein YckC
MTDQPVPPAPPAPPTQPEPGWAPAPPPAAPSSRPGPMPGYHYAGFWVRFLAFLIDGILLAVITAPFVPLWGSNFTASSANFQVHAQVDPVGTLIGLVYLAGMWSWRGQTIGMMPFNMKVVGVADGKNIDIFRAVLRYVGFIIAAIPLLIGLIWAAFDSRKQGWHDKIAGTLVIRPN